MEELFKELENELYLLRIMNDTYLENAWLDYKIARIDALINEIKKRTQNEPVHD